MLKIFQAALAIWGLTLTWGLGPALAGQNISLLIIDSDSYLSHQAVDGLTLSPDIQARVFCLEDLQDEESARFLAGSAIILVDVMDDKLSQYVVERDLLKGRSVFALRGSKDDSGLAARGFNFNPELAAYFGNLDRQNIQNMVRRAASLVLDPGLSYDPVKVVPQDGLYHPEAPQLFASAEEYLKWAGARPGHDQTRPWLGLMFFSGSLVEGQREAFDALIKKLESGGFNVLPAFGRDQVVIDSFFLDARRKPRVAAVLSFALKFYLAINDDLRRSIEDLGVPIFNAVNLYSLTIDQWRASEQGISPLDVIWTMATPEMSGVIEPIVLMGKVEDKAAGGGRVYHYELIPGLTERIIPRLHNWIKLQQKPNQDKKVAILYYNNSQGKQNIGASYLNVFRSLEEIVARMKEAGYQIPEGLSLNEDEIKGLVLRGGRNIGSWAPGELDALIKSGQTLELPVDEYKKWFAELPEDFQQKVMAQWGRPEDSDLMIRDGRIIIPLVRAGHLVLLPEAARGVTDDPMKLYHDPVLYPHHQYIAVYLWLQRGFQVDAMIHLGTHATYEWLPGKQAGLSASCPPEVMITDIPNIYPYIVDDVGEGIQAKRRGRGVVIDHLTPALIAAEGYHEYKELAEVVARYEAARAVDAPTAETYLAQIRAQALELGLIKELELTGINGPEDVQTLDIYLEYLETGYIPYGLHTFGRSPEGEALTATAGAILKQNKTLKSGDISADLKRSGPAETAAMLKALEGGYVQPAEGNDPVRNPAAIPTGRNFYGISPNRLPTPAAWKLGQEAAQKIIDQYIEEKGRYPEKVAVVLWAVETLRNEGLNESTILALIGVEPVWNPGGQVIGTRPIPAARLGRPRIDVAINASGLYRDLFPDKIIFLDAAIRQAAAQDDLENFISRNDGRIKKTLLESGLSEEEAGRFSRARIFSEAPGAYGNRVEELTSASGLWENDEAIADVYRTHTGFAYGGDFWGAPARASLDANLREAQVAWHSVSSSVYGVMDNDDMYMYLGGLSMAIRKLSGQAPRTLIADQRTLGQIAMEPLGKFIGQEMRARYLNPRWIEGMKAEKYAGAREMSNYVEYLWGWQVTTPEAVSEKAWEETFEVYVEDKYGQDLKEFLDRENPWAWQSLTGRMLESTRKGYWQATDETKQKLSIQYALSVISRGLACCDHTCNNPQFHHMVLNIISLPGVMSPELVAEFKLAVETAGQKSLEDMVAERVSLLENLGREKSAEAKAAAGPEAPEAALESVKGLKMEKVEEMAEKTSVSSSGVEWFASVFVLALVLLFFIGLRRNQRSTPN
ncbi:MAG: cobaltochelatase subunit CobN [Candidatus Adiutrix sp.]|jgi:cobaltochelatase CobN|nr:cobaltochelatase subunit CobN [Candidatus Adiutrix sp.]